ncbi:hypothetical protein GCM10027187_65010 [Streptosporangium sandarakinum]
MQGLGLTDRNAGRVFLLLPAALEDLARTGDWRTRGTTSASETRLGPLNPITATGWTYGETAAQMRQGPRDRAGRAPGKPPPEPSNDTPGNRPAKAVTGAT